MFSPYCRLDGKSQSKVTGTGPAASGRVHRGTGTRRVYQQGEQADCPRYGRMKLCCRTVCVTVDLRSAVRRFGLYGTWLLHNGKGRFLAEQGHRWVCRMERVRTAALLPPPGRLTRLVERGQPGAVAVSLLSSLSHWLGSAVAVRTEMQGQKKDSASWGKDALTAWWTAAGCEEGGDEALLQ